MTGNVREPDEGLLNPAAQIPYLADFPFFSRLPTELRLSIWEHTLYHERYLYVSLRPSASRGLGARPEQCECLELNVEDRYGLSQGTVTRAVGHYEVLVEELQSIDKLFLINRESRQVALRFYRVQLPCTYSWHDRPETRGTLYLNPELDTIDIKSCWKHFADFANDIYDRDERRVGLVNLAIHTVLDASTTSQIHSLRQAISRLKRVIFVPEYDCQVESISMLHGRTHFGNHKDSIQSFSEYRARPLNGGTIPKFDRLSQDPRKGLEAHLKNLKMDCLDPRAKMAHWNVLLEDLDLPTCEASAVEYRFLMAFGGRPFHGGRPRKDWRQKGVPPGPLPRWHADVFSQAYSLPEPRGHDTIRNRADANEWVQQQDARWLEALAMSRDRRRAEQVVQRAVDEQWVRWETKVFQETVAQEGPVDAHGPPHELGRGKRGFERAQARIQALQGSGTTAQSYVNDTEAEILNQSNMGTPQPAVGFWLFPIEALGPIPVPEDGRRIALLETFYRLSRTRKDLSGHPPELCVFHLP